MPTKILFGLSEKEIQKAIKELNKYKSDLNRKCEVFCERLTDLGRIVAEAKVAEAPLGKYITVSTDIHPEQMGCKAVLFAVGQEKTSQWQTQDGVKKATIQTLLMVEFGAGVSLNPVQNPKAGELGFGAGTFPGQSHAMEGSWSYMDMDGNWHSSKGIKATMPMYNASIEMILNIRKIAKEVFRS